MMRLHSPATIGAVLALLVTYTGAARCEPLSKAKIVAIGKDATVLIEAGNDPKVQASAFCVHRKGLFVTNDHVVSRSAETNVKVVIGSGLKSQRILKAKVIRQDPELDLALVQTEASAEIAPLKFGATSDLTELMDLFAFGYPFGSALANSSEDYPAISVNQATISSMRRKNGKLYRIQLDAALNPGNSGGPMLNSEGRVVGLVASGIRGSGVNLAIPASHVVKFLKKPELQFESPRLNRENRHQPATFRARSISFLPEHNELTLTLVLKTTEGKRREFEMNEKDETHFVDAVPVLAQTGPAVLRVQARYAGGTVDGVVNDREIQIGGTKVNLLNIKTLTLSPTPVAQLWDGKTLRGTLTKMDAIDVQIGAESLRLMHPRSAQDFRFEPPEEIGTVEATIVAFRNGAEVARKSRTINIAGVLGPSRFACRGTSITPPNISSEEVVRKLPAKVDDVVAGGSGRYLLLKMNEVKKIARFDVNKGNIDHYWPLPSDEIHFAANRTKLFVVLPDSGLIQQYDLASAKRDRVERLPIAAKIEAFAAGNASDGPLIIAVGASREPNQPYRPAGLMFLNSQTLETVERGWIGNSNVTNYLHGNTGVELRCSSDGQVVTAWRRGVSPSGILIFQLVGENAIKGWYDHTSVGHVVPGTNGDRVYTGKGVYEIDLLMQNSRIGNRKWNGPSCLPAVTGKYYLSWNLQFQSGSRRPGTSSQPVSKDVSAHLVGDSRTFTKLRNLTIPYAADYYSRDVLSYDKRVYFIPEAKLVVTIPETRDKLVLQRFDAEAALKDSNLDYLFVTSSAPTKARVGETYSYQITAMSRHAQLKYKIESGPDRLTVSPDGLVSWSIPQDYSRTSVTVIISVRNPNGAEEFENFTIEISK